MICLRSSPNSSSRIRSVSFLSLQTSHLLGQSRATSSKRAASLFSIPRSLRRPTDVLFSLDLELVEKLSSNIIFPWVGVGRSQCRNRGADSAGGWVISEEGILISAAGGKR